MSGTKSPLPHDHNYDVVGCPPYIKAKITELIHAAMEYALIGSEAPEHHEGITDSLLVSRYNLEATISKKLKGAASC